MNNGYYNYNQNQQGYYQGQNPNDPYAPPPVDPFGYPPPPTNPYMAEAAGKAATAKTYGIIALVGLFVMTILTIIFGILAITTANQSKRLIGYELPDAKSGRTMGTVSLIILGALFALGFFIGIMLVALGL
ncbi:MAG: hypothetical protein IKM08_01205 [Clostridia bacterium]|nr:hypothetical protein [Clostridia bacterium]